MKKIGFRCQVSGFSLAFFLCCFTFDAQALTLAKRTLQDGVYVSIEGACTAHVAYPSLRTDGALPEALADAFDGSVRTFAETHACPGRKEAGRKEVGRKETGRAKARHSKGRGGITRTVAYKTGEANGVLTVWMERVDTLPGKSPARVAAERFVLDAAHGTFTRTVERIPENLLPATDIYRDKGDRLYEPWRLTPRDYRE